MYFFGESVGALFLPHTNNFYFMHKFLPFNINLVLEIILELYL